MGWRASWTQQGPSCERHKNSFTVFLPSLLLFLLPLPSLPTVLDKSSLMVSVRHERGDAQKAGDNPGLGCRKTGWTH